MGWKQPKEPKWLTEVWNNAVKIRKQSMQQYRTIDGVKLVHHTSNPSEFAAAKKEAKASGLKYRVIGQQLYIQTKPMSNEQDNKPEMTAMQILINEVQTRIECCEQTYAMQRKYAGTINQNIRKEIRALRKKKAKYIKLRDTVEKDREDAAATIIQNLMDDMSGNGLSFTSSYESAKLFMLKFTTNGK